MGQAGGAPPEFGGKWHSRHGLEAIQKKLGITDDQKKQMRALYVGFSDRTRKARTELMAIKDEKRTMLMSGKIDQQKLAQLDDQAVKLRADVMRERLKLKRDRLAIMTPEQIEKLADLKASKAFRHKFEKMHGGMHGGHGRGHFGG
jgi:Spy/CpxP family protein refolding chaperone